jgi:hypothetical protein
VGATAGSGPARLALDTALELRNRLGAILDRLDSRQEPIIVEKDRKPRAVLP